ncbi:hypothetical protein DPV78_005704 [Talaromyces pinophilus]|nr:hypothetical protein DPV78_005704 [Talaromyces pinophilus]
MSDLQNVVAGIERKGGGGTDVMFSRTQVPVNASENLPIRDVSEILMQGEEERTARIEHATYRARDTGCAAGEDEFEAVAGYEGDVVCRCHIVGK